MERQSGAVLNDVLDDMEGSQKVQALKQVVEIESTLASIKFTKFGSLYYKHDLPQLVSTTPLYVVGNGIAVHNAEFAIGPINHRLVFDFGQGALDIDRGPCMLPSQHLNRDARSVKKRTAWLKTLPFFNHKYMVWRVANYDHGTIVASEPISLLSS
jgi:hypothetical protein